MTTSTSTTPAAKAPDAKAPDKVEDPLTGEKVAPQDASTAIAQPSVPLSPVVEDQQGVARHVSVGVTDGWEPAPVDPDPVQVKLAEERESAYAEQIDAVKNGRVDPVSGKFQTKKEWDKAQKSSSKTTT